MEARTSSWPFFAQLRSNFGVIPGDPQMEWLVSHPWQSYYMALNQPPTIQSWDAKDSGQVLILLRVASCSWPNKNALNHSVSKELGQLCEHFFAAGRFPRYITADRPRPLTPKNSHQSAQLPYSLHHLANSPVHEAQLPLLSPEDSNATGPVHYFIWHPKRKTSKPGVTSRFEALLPMKNEILAAHPYVWIPNVRPRFSEGGRRSNIPNYHSTGLTKSFLAPTKVAYAAIRAWLWQVLSVSYVQG